MISLDDYVVNMKPDQKLIYYTTSTWNSLSLERHIGKDLEVLFLSYPVDEVAIENLKSYKDKNLINIGREYFDLGQYVICAREKNEKVKQKFGKTCDWIKKRLGDRVANVQISNCLSSASCVLVSGKFGWSANMERVMKSQTTGDISSSEFMKGRSVLEINPDHDTIKYLQVACRNNSDDQDALKAIDLLYDAALVSSGFTVS